MNPKNLATVTMLTTAGAQDFPAAAKLLDAMSKLHTDNVPEVFDERRIEKTADMVAELVTKSENRVYVAKVEGQVVGVLRASIQKSEDTPGWRARRFGSIEAMFVEPLHRHTGIGTA